MDSQLPAAAAPTQGPLIYGSFATGAHELGATPVMQVLLVSSTCRHMAMGACPHPVRVRTHCASINVQSVTFPPIAGCSAAFVTLVNTTCTGEAMHRHLSCDVASALASPATPVTV